MVKRNKKLKKGVESLKKEIEEHFNRLEEEIETGNLESGRYHLKELDRSLIFAFEKKIGLLGEDKNLVREFRQRLKKLKHKIEM